ncbi:chorismate mutase [Haloplasma contractile]|uniref:Chorismate mutase domain-containing protein n=1 Tax=Haloplasma contractile SSD-17B TaxID=1033810 RepID=U2E9Y9_9MOLU|nr:chorismate mutase [Haloplasma contractile]ERJ11661.1 Chorismate mutase-prephenate dehydratase putative protein [Haloplasma contractile SSD-17B]
MHELKELRSQINNIDQELVKLIEMRLDIAIKIAKYKKRYNIKITDQSREAKVLEQNISYLNNKDYASIISEITKDIITFSKEVQGNVNNN